MLEKPPYKYVEVEWEDALGSDNEWLHEREFPAPVIVTSRGWLVKQELTYITLCSSWYEVAGERVWGEVLTIPMAMLQNMRELGV